MVAKTVAKVVAKTIKKTVEEIEIDHLLEDDFDELSFLLFVASRFDSVRACLVGAGDGD